MSSAVHAAHAAYSLDISDEEWLEQLSEILGPRLDRGRGVVSFRWRHESGRGVRPHEMHVHAGRRSDEAMLRELLARLDSRRAYLAYGAPYTYRSLSEIAHDHPTIDEITDDTDMQRHAHQYDVLDFEMLRVDLETGRGWMFSVMLDEVGSLAPPRRKLWERVGAHIAAGARLRDKLGGRGVDDAEAVFDPVTESLESVSDVFDTAERREKLLELIEARRHAESIANSDPVRAMELWQGLIDGRWSLLDVIDSDGRAFTVLHENPMYVRSTVALTERERQVAYLVGRGHHIKLVAYELGLSASTVRSQLRSALRKLNCDDRSALHRLVATVDGGDLAASLDSLGVLALSTKPLELPDSLSTAEKQVARMVYDGLSNAEMAERRGTATRTVANQLAAIYRKLEVDSRDELVRFLTSWKRP